MCDIQRDLVLPPRSSDNIHTDAVSRFPIISSGAPETNEHDRIIQIHLL